MQYLLIFRNLNIGAINVCDNTIVAAHSCLLQDANIPGIYLGVPAELIEK